MEFLVIILTLLLLLAVGALVFVTRRKPADTGQTSIHSSIESMRSMGQLSALRIFTKEIVTETDHSWGEIGKRYLSWVLSNKKMAMIFEFAIDIQYDLRSHDFAIHEAGQGAFTITMPTPTSVVNIRNICFYDEQGARLLPWLLPDLLNGFLPTGFGEQDKNRLVAAARAHAEEQARRLIEQCEPEVHDSAQATLRAICRSLGARDVTFEFLREVEREVSVRYPERLSTSGESPRPA